MIQTKNCSEILLYSFITRYLFDTSCTDGIDAILMAFTFWFENTSYNLEKLKDMLD